MENMERHTGEPQRRFRTQDQSPEAGVLPIREQLLERLWKKTMKMGLIINKKTGLFEDRNRFERLMSDQELTDMERQAFLKKEENEARRFLTMGEALRTEGEFGSAPSELISPPSLSEKEKSLLHKNQLIAFQNAIKKGTVPIDSKTGLHERKGLEILMNHHELTDKERISFLEREAQMAETFLKLREIIDFEEKNRGRLNEMLGPAIVSKKEKKEEREE